MKQISSYITEGLRINKNTKIKKINEDVLILDADVDKNYTFDLKLFLNNLEYLYKEYDDVPLSISLNNKIFFKLYNTAGINPNKININIASGTIKFLSIETYYKLDYMYSNNNAIEKILNIFKSKYKNYNNFTFNLYTEYNHTKYMYVWYSNIDNIIKIEFSNTEYKKLLNKDHFK